MDGMQRERDTVSLDMAPLESLYQERIEALRQEIAEYDAAGLSVDQEIAALGERMRALWDKQAHLTEEIRLLETQKSACIEQINDVTKRLRKAASDTRASKVLKKLLDAELVELGNERAMVLGKLGDLKNGLQRIQSDKQRIVPYGEKQDGMLRQAYQVLKEAQSRFELTIALNK
ncbi:hypothetical protein [Solidesulfovibrio magneticus]|uniref:MADS-box domain-containing protein n=1 Tax=Solidesulfovibrio magneticus (strain ATCC 700980 / DSM 13731 / RS-1) TaxID=573370 RepID=C4XP83_SOLM1|nr:hypothetical protein [Solidesulfovibrio magneticus]BAH77577.1 hypothetical protein DMR_40860 [Solidesulfovibrio magneticus RS-1]